MRNRQLIFIGIIIFLVASIASVTGLEVPQGQIFTTITQPQDIPQDTVNSFGSNTTDLSTVPLPSTSDSKTPVIRYSNENLPPTINGLIDHIDYQTTNEKRGQTYVYFKLPAPDASVNQSKEIGDFITSRKEWKGDRSADSVNAEIYIHWVADNALPLFSTNPVNEALYEQYVIGKGDKRPSPISPTHLGYNYSGLDKTNLMDQFLLTL